MRRVLKKEQQTGLVRFLLLIILGVFLLSFFNINVRSTVAEIWPRLKKVFQGMSETASIFRAKIANEVVNNSRD